VLLHREAWPGHPAEGKGNQFDQARRVLLEGFRWWKRLHQLQETSPEWGFPIRPFITELAEETAAQQMSCLHGSRCDELYGAGDGCLMRPSPFAGEYLAHDIRPRIEAASGAALAFLTTVAPLVKLPAQDAETPCSQLRDPVTCSLPHEFPDSEGQCVTCYGDRPFVFGQSCFAACPEGTVVRSAGFCEELGPNDCPNGMGHGAGGQCQECDVLSEGAECVDNCSGSKVVMDGNCVDDCPFGYVTVSFGICVPQSDDWIGPL
jgi:hypothetical protein